MTELKILPRSQWVTSGEPVTGPAFLGWAAMTDGVVWHFPGHDNPPRTPDAVAQAIRNTQHHYLTSRGYSIGYGWKLDPFGRLWECRGATYRNAANSGKKVPRNVNHSTVSVQVMTGIDGVPTAAQWATMPLVVAWIETQAGRRLDHRPHSHWDWTTCCGDPIRAWLAKGDIRPALTPTLPDPREDPDMMTIRIDGYADQFVAVPIDSMSARRKMGIPDAEQPVVVRANRAEIEARLPYRLTPLK